MPWIAGFIFLASIGGIVGYLVMFYPAVMSGGGSITGTILRALAGAGVGARLAQFSKCRRASPRSALCRTEIAFLKLCACA